MESHLTPDTGESLENILHSIKLGMTFPCYLIFGEEEYLIRDACDKITAAIIPSIDNDLNLFYMDGENENLDSLCTSLMTPPLLPGKKVIIVRNTRIFHSRQTIPELIRQIRMNLDHDPLKAAKDFFIFLDIAGWTIDDLINRGWEKITDEQWYQIVDETENAEERRAWLSKIIEFCVDNELKMPQNKDKADLLGDVLLRGIPDGNHLILTTDAVDKRKRIFKIIAQKGKVLNFSQVKGEAKQRILVMETARERLSASGKKMTPNAWTTIGKKTGFSLRGSMEALDKLINYTGDRQEIKDTDVEEIIEKTKEDTVFDLTSALVRKELGTALFSLDELLDRGVNHAQILSMIAREIRLLLHGKIYTSAGLLKPIDHKMDFNRFQKTIYPGIREIASAKGKGGKHLAGMHPYVLYNTLKNSEQFSTEQLIGYLQNLVAIDISLKTTARDPKLLLERFIVKFCT